MKIKTRLRPLYFVDDPGGEGGDGGDGGNEGGASGGSVLNGGKNNEPTTNEWDHVPEKYQVFEGEGDAKKFDLQSSSKKMADAHKQLETRLGDTELPPAEVSGYKIDAEKMGENFNAEEFMADESTQGFLKRMHAKGINNAQLNDVLDYAFNEWAPQLIGANDAMTEETCSAALKEVWKSDEEFSNGTGLAFKALKAFASNDSEFGSLMEKYGNDPDFIQFAARVGKEVNEDSGVDPDTVLGGESVESLMASAAYKDEKHPDHVAVSAKVKRYFDVKHPGGLAA